MEFALNLAWMLLATLLFYFWLRFGRHAGAQPRMQLVALTVLIVILFPVISVTDDLQAIQNPAETDSSLRRDHAVSAHPSSFPAVATLLPPVRAELSFGSRHLAVPGRLRAILADPPALSSIQSRPPPAV
jgi:hypothetical protein